MWTNPVDVVSYSKATGIFVSIKKTKKKKNKSNRYETNLGVLMSSLNGILPLLVIGPLVLIILYFVLCFFPSGRTEPVGAVLYLFLTLFSAAKGLPFMC